MPERNRQAVNPTRERRIEDEIVVDAYGPEERALGWYYYLQDRLTFPCAGRCISTHVLSPLKMGERVEIVGMAPEDACVQRMFVVVRALGRSFSAPLEQLSFDGADADAKTALADWRYWSERGYGF